MPLQRADVALLNSAIENAGEGALQRRKLNQEHETEMSRLALESQLRDIQESRYNAQEAHYNTMEDQNQSNATARLGVQADAQKQKGVQLASKIVTDTMKNYAGYVKDGLMDPEVATDLVKSSFSKIPPETASQLQDNPEYNAVMDDQFAFKAPPGKPGVKDDNLIARDKYAQQLKQQAQQAAESGDQDAADDLNQRASKIAGSIGANDPTQFQTVTTKTDKQAAKDAEVTPGSGPSIMNRVTGGTYGSAGTPPVTNSPAVPEIPATTTTRKVPVGAPAAATQQPPTLTPADTTLVGQSPSLPPAAVSALGQGAPTAQVPGMGAAKPAMVRVRHPNGQTGSIPADQLPAAIQQGFTPIQDGNQP